MPAIKTFRWCSEQKLERGAEAVEPGTLSLWMDLFSLDSVIFFIVKTKTIVDSRPKWAKSITKKTSFGLWGGMNASFPKNEREKLRVGGYICVNTHLPRFQAIALPR